MCIRDSYPPVADPQAPFIAALKSADVALGKAIDCIPNALSVCGAQSTQPLDRTLLDRDTPVARRGQLVELLRVFVGLASSFLASSHGMLSSARAALIAARSSAVTGSSSRGVCPSLRRTGSLSFRSTAIARPAAASRTPATNHELFESPRALARPRWTSLRASATVSPRRGATTGGGAITRTNLQVGMVPVTRTNSAGCGR